MRPPSIWRPLAFLLLPLLGCNSQPAPPQLSTEKQALFVNGGLEADAIGVSPSSWTVAAYLNNGLGAVPPQSTNDLALGTGGVLDTFVVGGATEIQSDPNLGASATLRYPKFGVRSAVVNTGVTGRNRNANSMKQTMTVVAGDVDPSDGQVHVRFVAAAVLQNPAHLDRQQPYFFIQLTNLTRGTVLYTNFNFAGQLGVPWKTITSTASCTATTPCQYTDWQLVDIAPGSQVAIGDQVELQVYAAGCSLGGHWGRVYVDAFGPVIPGLFVSGVGPASAFDDTNITYTLTYKNGGASATAGTQASFVTPPSTTFQATSQAGCATPAVGAAGTVTCPLGALAAGASGSFTVTAHINAGTTGLLTAGNYWIQATGVSPLLGAKIDTVVTGVPASIAVVSGSPQTTTVGTAFSAPLLVVVKDASGIVVPNVTVTFTPPGSGASAALSSGTATTNASGQATVTATASTTAGSYAVGATVGGVGTPASFSLTNTAGAPASIAVVSGSPQTGTVGTTFASSLIVVVRDTNSNVVPNVTVTFTPPASGASATLSSGTATTNASGQASVTATANTTAGSYSVSATVAGVGAPASFSLTNTAGAPASIAVVSGSPQSRTVGTAFASPLLVVVRDANGNVVPNATVTFTPPGSGASATLSSGTATTDASGQASVTATANTTAGSYTVNATAAGVGAPASFSLTNTAGAPASIAVVSGSPQSRTVGTAFASPLLVVVRDANGNVVPNATVTFTPPGSGASATLSGGTATTNASGQASVTATANTTAGSYTVNATAAGVGAPASFSLTNTAGAPASIAVVSGSPQSRTVGTAFASPLLVVVRDANGNVVPGVTVTFTPPGSGASATLSGGTATTNASGQASVTATANATAGAYAVNATVAGVATPASFSLTNTAGAPASIAVVSGSPQTRTVGAAFASPLVVVVRDANGNVVPNATVTFTPPGSGASATLSGGTATTNASGQASVTATANATAGSYTVNATVAGVGTPASFSLTNTAGAPASIAVVSGSPQTRTVGAAFASPLLVVVRDANGNVVPNATVTFTPPGSGASATLSGGTATTNASGQASVTATANTTAGSYTVNATVAGVGAPASFSMTNTAGAPASIAVVSGSPQTGTAGTAFASPLVVVVRDANGNVVPNVTVTFTPPGSGTSATLSSGTATTNASGQASVTATANATAGSYSVSATVAGVGTPASFSLTNTAGAPASIAVVSGNPQTTTVGTAFSAPLLVVVRDANGNVVSNATVNFTPPGSGASSALSGGTATTNASGQASVTATANATAGSYSVSATVAGVGTPASFSLTNTAGAPASIAVVSGTPQSTTVGTAFTAPLLVVVKDADGNVVPSAAVTFAPPASGASAAMSTSATTDASGQASVTATANAIAGGPYSVTASVAGVATSATFQLTNLTGAPASISVVSGGSQSATVLLAFAQPLVVAVKDASGNSVPNFTVTFASPDSGASATLSTTATTDSSGQASANATANAIAGGPYSVTASVAGAAASAPFSLTNLPGAPTAIAVVSGGSQSATVLLAFAQPLVVAVKDAQGNLVPGIEVTFAPPSSGASATMSAKATTDSSGQASVTATANATAGGPYAALASIAGVSAPASFSLTNLPGAPASIDVVGGGAQSATVRTAFAQPLVVGVKDAQGNLVPGATVTYAAPATGASAVVAPTATTDASGQASVTATANDLAGGPYAVTATVPGAVSEASFALSNLPGAATTIQIAFGDAQQAVVGTAYEKPLVVTVLDAIGNRLPNTAVTFSVPSSGASATLSALVLLTDASGQASVTATASTVAGAFQVAASLGGAATPALFSLTNLPGAAESLRIVSGGVQTTAVNTAFAAPLVAQALDAWSNRVPGAHVTWAAPTTGASAVPSSTDVTTDSSGQASITATANGTAGTYPLTAKLAGGQQADFILTNADASALAIAAESGAPQSAGVGTAFAAPLVVLVTSGGSPVANAPVTFQVPIVGASATLAAITATTDATGHAQVLATAGRIAGTYTIVASTPRSSQPASFALANLPGAPARIVASPGSTPQAAQVGGAFAVPLVASVLDAFDNPVPGIAVTFAAPASAPTATLEATFAVITDSSGQAATHATAGSTAGAYAVLATTAGVQGSASFSLTNSTGAPQTISIVSGSPQSTQVGTAFAAPLTVLVSDASGNPAAGATVTFTAPTAGAAATLSSATATTDAGGIAHVDATANTVAGRYGVLAALDSGAAPVRFELENAPGAPAAIAALNHSTPQSARVGNAYALPLTVVVTDAYGNTVPGATVSFDAPATEPTAALTATPPATDAAGLASVAAIASRHSGPFKVSATVAGVSAPAVFDLMNLAGDPATLAVIGGANQTTLATTAFPEPLVVLVTDADGNPVSGAAISLTVPSSGPTASATPDHPTTDAAGRASIQLVASDQPGAFVASLAVAGGSAPVQIPLTITAIPTTTTLAMAPAAPTLGEHLTLTATVASEHGTPTGQVHFTVDGEDLGAATLVDGVATLTLDAPAIGSHPVAAVYDAQGAFGASASAPQELTVSRDAGRLNGGGGCSAAASGGPVGPSFLFALLLVLAFASRRRRVLRALAALAAAGGLAAAPGAARAQTSTGTQIDTFHAAPAGSDWFSLDSLDFRGRLRPAVRLLLDWGRDPLVLYNADGSRRSVALQNQLFLNVGGSVVLLDRFRLALNAPVALYQNGASSLFDGVQVSPQSAGGIGDLALAVDVRILGAYGEAFALAVGIDVAMPTGSRGNLLGNGSVSAVPRVSAAGDLGLFAYAAQVGFVVRSPGQIANIRFNDEVRFAASGGLRLLSRRLLVGPELYASADVGKSGGQARSTALEGDLGAHYQFGSGFSAGLGVGTGLARSPGVPKVRGLASIGWSPVPAREVRPSDRDGDGVPDLADACPDEAGPPSNDPKLNGCPVPADRDQDGVPDAQDLCPDVPKGEHPDPDRLGCPDKDTDGDGIFDHSDQCPTVPAGRHPDPQRLGCPDGDRDRDGIVDSADQCPDVAAGLHPDPEKPGCPLPDRDGDGVPDKVDACPDKPGAPDPDPKKNGCPGLVQLKDAQIVILQQVLFATDKDVILKESYPVLRAVANILKMEPNIKHVSIEGHTDTQGKPAHNLDLSERRAKSVKKWLVAQGIAEERLESHGFGQTKPVSDNKSAKGRAANRRVEFHILDQANPAE